MEGPQGSTWSAAWPVHSHDRVLPRVPCAYVPVACTIESMSRYGLTGGIAAGKSEVAQRLGEHGAVVIDHDVLARRAVEPGSEGLARIVQEFGSGVVSADGSLDRSALGALVFADNDARARLNAIVHPAVHALADVAERVALEDNRIVIHDIPLLVETGQEKNFDGVIVVEAPREVRIGRMVSNRGMSREEAIARISAQASDEQRRDAADFLLVNDGSRAELMRSIDEVWERILRATSA